MTDETQAAQRDALQRAAHERWMAWEFATLGEELTESEKAYGAALEHAAQDDELPV